MAQGKRIKVSKIDLREFIEAAEEVREEATAAEIPNLSGMVPGARFNALCESTEDRYVRALDTLEFELAAVSRG
jgi:hypothetical protein